MCYKKTTTKKPKMTFHSCCFRSVPALIKHWSQQRLQRSCTATHSFISPRTPQNHCHTPTITSSSHHFSIFSQLSIHLSILLHIIPQNALLSSTCTLLILCQMNLVCSCPLAFTKLVCFLSVEFISLPIIGVSQSRSGAAVWLTAAVMCKALWTSHI